MPNPLDPNVRSSYLDNLPAIFQQDSVEGRPNFLGRYLLAFEQILTGLENDQSPGLEEILNGFTVSGSNGETSRPLSGIQRYFEAGGNFNGNSDRQFDIGERTPSDFLEWLSGWVALTLRADLNEEQQRNFIARAVSLYRLRGTLAGLQEMLRIYTQGSEVTINEFVSSAPDEPERAHFFRVTIVLPVVDLTLISRQRKIAAAIIDLEKPAHTTYELTILPPVMQVGVPGRCNVGVNTYLVPRI